MSKGESQMMTVRLYALSILSQRDETMIGEAEFLPAVMTHHRAFITKAASAEEAEAIGLKLVNERKPESDGWSHSVNVLPFDLAVESISGTLRISINTVGE